MIGIIIFCSCVAFAIVVVGLVFCQSEPIPKPPKALGTMVILYDEVDNEKHFALEIEESVLQRIGDGDTVILTVKVLRQ